MVPRWRPAAQTLRLGEFTPLRVTVPSEIRSPGLLEGLTNDWNEHRRFGYAADLVSAALTLGIDDIPSAVREAAEFILAEIRADDPRPVREIAARLLAKPVTVESVNTSASDAGSIYARLRVGRIATRIYPYNPLLWVDMARDYASLGQTDSAERAMRVAIGLAPKNRFVLRSFTRLALHLAQRDHTELPEEALRRLRRLTRVVGDPWLVAAEIATSMVLGKTASSIKSGRTLLHSGDFDSFELSELAGALGSMEMDAGGTKAGRKLFAQALVRPTDNVVAQAAWTARHFDSSVLDPRSLQGPVTFEARAWELFRAGDWNDAVNEAMSWHHDEPFASRPIHLATFISAVVLADFSLAAQLARVGLDVNAQDQTIRNNLAFALASDGKPSEAETVLGELHPSNVRDDIKIAYIATWGLISFRKGSLQDGRELYEAAIEQARRQRDATSEALATLYLAREERIAKTSNADASVRRAADLVSASSLGYLQKVLEQVRSLPDADGNIRDAKALTSKPRRAWIRF